MRFRVALPTAVGDAGDAARALGAALGTAYQGPDGSVHASDLLAVGAAIATMTGRVRAAMNEAYPGSAVELLDEWEVMLGLPVDPYLGTAARQARLLARWRSLRGGTPQAIALAVTALLSGGDVATVHEVSPALVTATPERVFRFAVKVPLAYHLDAFTASEMRSTVEAMKPAHTQAAITNRIGFRTDDPDSLTDLTLLAS